MPTARSRTDPKRGLLSVNGNFQPIKVARFDEVLATKLPVDPRLPPTDLEQADRNWLQPVMVCMSR